MMSEREKSRCIILGCLLTWSWSPLDQGSLATLRWRYCSADVPGAISGRLADSALRRIVGPRYPFLVGSSTVPAAEIRWP